MGIWRVQNHGAGMRGLRAAREVVLAMAFHFHIQQNSQKRRSLLRGWQHMRSHRGQQRIWADGRDFVTDPKAALFRPSSVQGSVTVPCVCEHECDRCGWGLEGGLLYILYLCNQRDMLMLFFSSSVSQGSETGLEGDGGELQLASSGSFSFILRVGWTSGTLPLPLPHVDLNSVGAQRANLIFAFSPVPHRPNSSVWGLVLQTGVLPLPPRAYSCPYSAMWMCISWSPCHLLP